MDDPNDSQILESLARESRVPLDTVIGLYRHERDALTREARIPHYISLLAARRVRHRLQHTRGASR